MERTRSDRPRSPYFPPFQRFSNEEVEEFHRKVMEFRADLKAKAKVDRGNSRLLRADIETLVLMIGTLGPFTNREIMVLCGYSTHSTRGNSSFRLAKIKERIHERLMDGGMRGEPGRSVLCYWTTRLGAQLVELEPPSDE
jgi:hypothetical protein